MNAKREERLIKWILLIAGLSGIGYQQYTGETSWLLLLIFTSMTGVPGLASIISLMRSSLTTLQSASSQPQLSESDLGNSSQSSLTDEQ